MYQQNVYPETIKLYLFQVAQLTQSAAETEEMSSQLNPDAEEFVPVSPTRNIASPACQALINDHIISQSPTRYVGNSMNINVPSLQEFEAEVKSRPSEVEFNEKENVSPPLEFHMFSRALVWL